MNFLAHIYLSGSDEELIIGNFIADSVKGKKYKTFPLGIQKGILLHRAIDTFTDSHPIPKKSKEKLYKGYSHYSGVIVDMLYDHFLAVNWRKYSNRPLEDFVTDFYTLLQENYEVLPRQVQQFLPIMVENNWLLSYREVEGLRKILYQMDSRTQYKSGMNKSIRELEKYYTEFENEFFSFFTILRDYTSNQIKTLSL